MAFSFFGSKKQKRDFSDADIDRFVAYLKEHNMTMTQEEAQAALHAQSNDDPRRLREKKFPKALLIPNSSAIYRLWSEWAEKPADLQFEPLEFMVERMEEAHETYLKNRAALESGGFTPVPDANAQRVPHGQEELDENQKEMLNFESELERYAEKFYNRVLQEQSAASTRRIHQIHQELQQTEDEQPEELDNLAAFGGFSSREEAEAELAQFQERPQTDESASEEDSVEATPVDADIQLRLTRSCVRAWLFILPPRNGGQDVTEAQLRQCLNENAVRYGVDTYTLRKIAAKKLYFKMIQIATGLDALNGTNGHVEELVQREKKIDLKEDEHGNVDYKELNIIASVHKGDTICHIVLPTKGKDGYNVRGEIIKGVEGHYPAVPQGRNTQLNEDGSRLLATIDGEVVFERGTFRVQKLLNIPGDVDNATGNIKFAGDVIINGDVRDGYSVHATGRLYIKGTVEAAQISSDSDITIERGMTGGQKGTITCGGMLQCKYLENCKAYARGKIYVDNIVFSEVASDDAVVITLERGSITGGKITAGKMVDAKFIGSRNNSGLVTKIVLGCTPNMLDKQFELQKKQENIDSNITKLNQNIRYIENGPQSTKEERKGMLDQLKLQLQMRLLQKAQVDKQLSALTGELFNNNARCQLVCDHLFPTVVVTIAESSMTIREEENFIKVFMRDGEIILDNR